MSHPSFLPLATKRAVRLRGWLLLLLASAAGGAFGAGIESLELPAFGGQPAIQAMVWSPCSSPPRPLDLGPYTIAGVRNCAISGNALPLVVISHGQGGSMLGHYDTAVALADVGFVVVSFKHPGDSVGDDSASHTLGIFESRPRDASRVISFMLQRWPQRQHLDASAIGAFGFSRGGYTALALAGAVPSATASAARFCGYWWSFVSADCRQLTATDAQLTARPDPRVRAVVAMDPLNLFDAAGLKPVRIPVQLWASELGGEGVALEHVEEIKTGMPAVREYHVAQGAGHFAYLAPCSPVLRKAARHLCEDPAGFDRAAWHQTMNAAIIKFFAQHLRPGSAPDGGLVHDGRPGR